jgi:hypothetical protein
MRRAGNDFKSFDLVTNNKITTMTDSERKKQNEIKRSAMRYLEQNNLKKASEVLITFFASLPPEAQAVTKRIDKDGRPWHLTRFFIRYAREYSVRFSALLLLAVVYTERMYKKSKDAEGIRVTWHSPADWYARQLGIDRRQFFRLLEQARQEKFLCSESTGRGVLIWVINKSLYTEFFKDQTAAEDGRRTLGFYCRLHARALGLNGAMIYALLKKPDDEGGYCKMTPDRVAKALPWMTEIQARNHLTELWMRGVIQREQSQHQLVCCGKTGYRYFWKERSEVDYQKWKIYSQRIHS